jgi:hypothetical protein
MSVSDVLEIELPESVSAEAAAELETELRRIDEVEDAGSTDVRGIEVEVLGLWVQLVSNALAAVSVGVPIVQRIVSLIRGRDIQGAKLKFPDGTEVSVDRASAEQLERIIAAARREE